ncbi:uncharacterized protein LOC119077132 [Bradysia coprophila]|uniref:uncharacterized protein LOC119077132 n=1 Tax=Bradysia coprophila TaxID=38358 RepID=UPI00187DBE0C|nr:uncharacterized protein LOC119077132 [Bradysia coprophila]
MDGFNDDDTIPSFNSSALIEESDEDDGNIEGGIDYEYVDDDDRSRSSLDSYEGTYRTTKRFKNAIATENSFKMNVMKILKRSCEVAGDFAVSGRMDRTPLIAISLKNKRDGVDEAIRFPLSENEVTKIIKCFESSPYGRATETIADRTVRSSLQLSPDNFEILNSDWDNFIKVDLVNLVQKELSLNCTVVASLNKLLIYQPGSVFKSHCDSEKEENMFGMLVVQLPSKFKGGQLVVRHDGKAKIFDFSSMDGSTNNTFSTFFAAFYCACEHEILPITEGYRLCLVYNLIAIKPDIPTAPKSRESEMELIKLLRNWEGPRKLVYALSHRYSEANLAFKNLKTTDKIVADILLQVSEACELNIFLAIFEKNCSGYYRDDEEITNCSGCATDYVGNFDGEFDEISYALKAIISDDKKVNWSRLLTNFNKEVIPTDCFDSIEPYQQDCAHSENEDVRIMKWYSCAAITLWPKRSTFHVLKASKAETNVMDMFFIKEAKCYFDNGCNAEDKKEILEWANYIVSQKRYKLIGVLDIVTTIIKFNNIGLIQKLIPNGVVRSPKAFSLILKECDKFGWEHFATSMVDVIKGAARRYAIRILNMCFGGGYLNPNKSKVFLTLLQAIFEKGNSEDSFNFNFSSEDKIKQQKEDKELLEPLVNIVLRFNNLKLVQDFVKFVLPLHSETIFLLATICAQYGWQSFETTITEKLNKKSKKDQIVTLTLLIQTGFLNDDKKALCLKLFGIMFDKNEEFVHDPLHLYNRANSQAEIIKRRKDEKELLEPLINAASSFNNVQLLKNIFQRMALHSETIPLLIDPSQTYGWNAFATEIGNKFIKLSQIDAIDTLSVLIGIDNFKEEKGLCFNLFRMVLEKQHAPLSSNLRRITQEEQVKFLREKHHILHSICCMAEKIEFNLLPFAQRQSFKDFVPVLLLLAQKETTTNRLSTFWSAIVQHFMAEIHTELKKPIQISWRHCTDSLYACCNDCTMLKTFVGSNKETEIFKMGDQRRKHLQHRINLLGKLTYRMEIAGRGQIGLMIVTKTETNTSEAIRNQNLGRALSDKLQAVMPHNLVTNV